MEQEDIVIEGIAISNIEMKKERIAALVAIFLRGGANNSTLVSFSIMPTFAKNEGIVWLSKLVEVSPKLQEFGFQHNRIITLNRPVAFLGC